ncbi:MAG: hypothetical protein MUC87_20875 [Bacteroidia bacterium]|nr:hypothetical protein [Bacteroidia bacterium]
MSEKQNRIIRECFEMQITGAQQSVKGSFIVDKNAATIFGIVLSSNRDDLLYFRGKQSLHINGEEFLPANYESKFLMHGLQLPGAERYFELGEINPGNRIVDVNYTDTPNDDMAGFAPYTVFVNVYSRRM